MFPSLYNICKAKAFLNCLLYKSVSLSCLWVLFRVHDTNMNHLKVKKGAFNVYFSVFISLFIFSGICFLIYLHFTFDQSSTCFTTFSNFKPFLPFIQAVCECVPLALFDAITWLGYCNSTINPIIYPLFMRDFKRALGKLLPCCSSRSTRRPSPALSLSLRNSGEPNLASSPPSPLASDPTHPPATATDAVNLLDAEHAGVELPLLLPNQVDSLD